MSGAILPGKRQHPRAAGDVDPHPVGATHRTGTAGDLAGRIGEVEEYGAAWEDGAVNDARAQAAPPATAPRHAERLSVPLRWWVQGVMLVASLWLALVVATPGVVAWSATAVCLLLLTVLLVGYGSARVRVEDGTLYAGRAQVAAHHLGSAVALDAEQTRLLAGRDADARAFLLLRPYLKRAVRVELLDPRDPTPYWLISTRRPVELAAAVHAAATTPVTGSGSATG